MNRPEVVARPARSLAALGTPAITYLCTACSFVGGHDGERALRNAMRHPGVQTTLTAAGSVIDALSAVGAKRISVAHPYEPPVGAALVRFLGTAGFDVLTEHSLGLQTIREVYDIGYREVRELIANADHAEADALFVSCTALPTYDLIAPLERELGKPIITVNQATMWAGLRSIGHRLQGPGQRLAAITDSQIPWRR
ncbi:Asp/Glu racemase [Sciscionella marina]|uniref:maleate cis-trans isomerase family protein n=1 Tax=Sciscionella marina TaxID=508770 RepID=UPI001F097B14|nr:Asp/Glu racemase [Sciscionella marina]